MKDGRGSHSGVRQGSLRYNAREAPQISACDFDLGTLLVELARRSPRRGACRPITAGFACLRKFWSVPLDHALALADVSAEYEAAMQPFSVRRRGTLLPCIAASLVLPPGERRLRGAPPGIKHSRHPRSRSAEAPVVTR